MSPQDLADGGQKPEVKNFERPSLDQGVARRGQWNSQERCSYRP